MRFVSGLFVGASALALTASSFAGPDWVEDGDAGSSQITAQPVTNVVGGQVQRIIGQLTGVANLAGGADFEDVYLINITDPQNFMVSTSEQFGGFADFQTSLWLFDYEGFGQLGNVYTPQNLPEGSLFGEGGGGGGAIGSTLFNYATDATKWVVNKPGLYYLAITGVPNHPLASGATEGQDIFTFDQWDEISGPDGPAGTQFPWLKWWWGEGETGSYELVVHGVGEVPAPGAMGLLLIGAAGFRRRRRA